jgi:hypothetical protein
MTATAAVDMFVVATATFKLLYAHTSAQCRDVSIALRRAPARTASEVSWEAAMRAIFIGIVMLSASIAVVHTAEARDRTQNHPRAPVGHRHPTRNDLKNDNQFGETSRTKEGDQQAKSTA